MSASVEITWSTENNGLADHYNVYKASTTPVDVSVLTPLNATNIPATTNSFFDNNVPDGTYYYVVEAVDANGNKETTAEYTVSVSCAI